MRSKTKVTRLVITLLYHSNGKELPWVAPGIEIHAFIFLKFIYLFIYFYFLHNKFVISGHKKIASKLIQVYYPAKER